MKQGWEIKKLSQLFDVKSSRRVLQSDWKSSGIPFYRAREVVKLARDGNVVNDLYISQELYDDLVKGKGAPKAGDIIVSAVGTLGQCYLVTESDKFYFKDASVLWLENSGNVNSRYIEYAFKADSIIAQVMEGSMGATVGTLTISRAKEIEIPLPPLPEQQRIVSILDEVFEAIAKAKANAEQNLKNAKDLFDSYLQNVFETKGEGWEEKTLGEVCELINRGVSPKYLEGNGVVVLNQKCIRDHKISFEKSRFHDGISKKVAPEKMIKLGDVLINSTGTGTLGRVAQVREEFKNVTVDSHVTIVRPIQDLFFLDFFGWGLIFIEDEISKRGEGCGGQTELARTALKNDFSICFPKSLKAQQAIAQKLDALSGETKKLENIYQQKINDLEELKKSVLQKAFSGDLYTPTSLKDIQKAEVSMSKPSVKVIKISPTDLQAGIVAIALQRHQQENRENTFHHVKAEKIVHLAQFLLKLELDRNPCKDAAGPNDFPHAKKVESRAKKAGFYTVLKKENLYEYSAGTQIQKLIDKTYLALDEKSESLNKLIDLIVPMSTQQAEIFATVYAGWNNLLIDGIVITDEDIVKESRENWHQDKLKIEREKFFKAIKWMREKNLIPTGMGNKVVKKVPAKK